MTPIQSREEVASSIASGINSTAAEKIPEEANYAASISGVLNDFVGLIHGVAAEFVAMDSNIASNINANTSNLPETSAAPGESGEFVPNSGYFAE